MNPKCSHTKSLIFWREYFTTWKLFGQDSIKKWNFSECANSNHFSMKLKILTLNQNHIALTGWIYKNKTPSRNGRASLTSSMEVSRLPKYISTKLKNVSGTKATLRLKTSTYLIYLPRDRMIHYPFINIMRKYPSYIKLGPMRLVQVQVKTDGKPLEIHFEFKSFIKGQVNIYGFILSKST